MKSDLAVLVDVDQTLVLGQDKINFELIGALKKAGITQIYLFTSMSMGDLISKITLESYVSREELIEVLKDQGIEVVSVITPADIAYDEGLGEAYKKLYLPQYARRDELTEENYINDVEFVKARDRYALLNRKVNELVRHKKDVTTKALMFEYFIFNKPKVINKIAVIDNDVVELGSIVKVAANYTGFTLKSILIKEDSDKKTIFSQLKEFAKKSLFGLFCGERRGSVEEPSQVSLRA